MDPVVLHQNGAEVRTRGGPGQGPQDDPQHTEEEAVAVQGEEHRAQQARQGPRQGGRRLLAL